MLSPLPHWLFVIVGNFSYKLASPSLRIAGDGIKLGSPRRICVSVLSPSESFGVAVVDALHARPLVFSEVGSGTSHVNVHDKPVLW